MDAAQFIGIDLVVRSRSSLASLVAALPDARRPLSLTGRPMASLLVLDGGGSRGTAETASRQLIGKLEGLTSLAHRVDRHRGCPGAGGDRWARAAPFRRTALGVGLAAGWCGDRGDVVGPRSRWRAARQSCRARTGWAVGATTDGAPVVPMNHPDRGYSLSRIQSADADMKHERWTRVRDVDSPDWTRETT